MKMLLAASILVASVHTDDAGLTDVGDAKEKCQADFIIVDKDGDNALSGPEIAGASSLVPAAVASKTRITQDEYLAACLGTTRNP